VNTTARPDSAEPTPGVAVADDLDEGTARSASTVAVWTLLSRSAGMARVLVIGGLMGPTYLANVFQAGSTLPNQVFTLFAGPVLAMVLVPAVVRAVAAGGPERACELLGKVTGRLLGVSLVGALGLAVTSPLLAYLLVLGVPDATHDRAWLLTIVLILFVVPQVLGYTVAALGVAAQQGRGRFGLAAAAPTVESLGTILTVILVTAVYGYGIEVDAAPLAMVIWFGVGNTLAVLAHAALQVWGAARVGLLARPRRGWREDPEARACWTRIVGSMPVAACPSAVGYLLSVAAGTVPGGVLVVQLANQVGNALSYVGGRAVGMAAMPRLSAAAAGHDVDRFGAAWRHALFLGVAAALPPLFLLAVFANPTADLLANGELRNPWLIVQLGGCLVVAAFFQLAAGLHDLARQALFARLDHRTPTVAVLVGLATGILFGTAGMLLLEDAGARLTALMVALLADEVAGAIVTFVVLRREVRPASFARARHVGATVAATLAAAPVVAAGWWLIRTLEPGRGGELGLLAACGVVCLVPYVLTLSKLAPEPLLHRD
jgi:putative peptidoglycan lipid II flippase